MLEENNIRCFATTNINSRFDRFLEWDPLLLWPESGNFVGLVVYSLHQSLREKLSCCLSNIAYFRIEMFYCAMMMPVREYCGMDYIVEAMLSGGLGEATLLLIVSLCQRIHCCKQTRDVRNKPTTCPFFVRNYLIF